MECAEVEKLVADAKAAADTKQHAKETAFLTRKLSEWGLDATVDPTTGEAKLCGVTLTAQEDFDYEMVRGKAGATKKVKKGLIVMANTGCKHYGVLALSSGAMHGPGYYSSGWRISDLGDLQEPLKSAKDCAAYQAEKDAAQAFKAALMAPLETEAAGRQDPRICRECGRKNRRGLFG